MKHKRLKNIYRVITGACGFIAAAPVFVFFILFIISSPAYAQDAKTQVCLSYISKTYKLIRTYYYKLEEPEKLIKGAVSGMKKVTRLPEPPGYSPEVFNSYFISSCRKHPNLSGELGEAAINGMVESLQDPYSVLLTLDKKRALEGGDGSIVGLEMGYKDGRVIVIAPLVGSPAEKAGLKSGDIVTAINGRSISGLNLYEASMLILGRRGDEISITVKRRDKKITLKPVFAKVKIDPIRYAILNNNIGYIKIGIFSGKIFGEFNYVLNVMKKKKVRGLILDLRNNPGGDFIEALRVAARFVPDGALVWVKKEGVEAKPRVSASGETFPASVVILVNEGTASAAEILAAAVSENGRAILIGRDTFGKGTIQTAYKLTGSAELNLTTEAYLTPRKNSINGTGLKPYIRLKDERQSRNPSDDPFVIEAWKYLRNKTSYSKSLK